MREHRYTLEMPHSPERLWALFQDYDRWTDYAPMVLEVQVVHPGDDAGNGLLRRVIYKMPFGRRGSALELVTEIEANRCYTFTMLSREPGQDQTGKVRLERIGPNRTKFSFEERYNLTKIPWKWFEGPIYKFINKNNEQSMQRASAWLTQHGEYRPDLVETSASARRSQRVTLPEKMQAAVLRGKDELVVEEVAVPDVGPSDVLVEVSHCGVCGSDLHLVLDGWGRRGSIGGHEWSGVVVAAGNGVTRWSVGDSVIGGPTPRCGQCEMCRTGHPTLCSDRNTPGTGGEFQGAFARYTKVDERELLRVPDGLTLREAALAEPLAVALHGITNSGVRPGQRALVLGAGPIGALTIAALRALGIDDIKVSEPAPVRQELARRLGASVVVGPDELETPGPFDPGTLVDDAFDVVLECSGHGEAMEAGLAQLKRRGTLCLVGAGMGAPRFDPNRILLNELVITGAFCYDADGFERSLELLASGRLPLAELIDPVDIPLAGALDAMHGLAGGQIAAKVLIAPGAAS